MRLFSKLGVPAAAFSILGMAAEAPPFHWAGNVASGQTVEIKGVNGRVIAERGTSGQVVVDASRTGKKSDPNEVRIEVVPHGAGVTICAVYPGNDNSCAPGREGRMQVRDNDVQVAFTVKVPSGVNFSGKTVNGSLEALDIPGDVHARTVNGNIKVDAAGIADGETVNGNVEVRMGRSPAGELSFKTVNGTINVVIPGAINAEFAGSTVNGGIHVDQPLTVQGTVSSRKVSGRMGSGGPALKMSTVNGDINLKSH